MSMSSSKAKTAVKYMKMLMLDANNFPYVGKSPSVTITTVTINIAPIPHTYSLFEVKFL